MIEFSLDETAAPDDQAIKLAAFVKEQLERLGNDTPRSRFIDTLNLCTTCGSFDCDGWCEYHTDLE